MEYFTLIFIIYLLVINIVSFVMIGYDKRRARKGEWRISEKKLFLYALIGGALGIYFGMKRFRHKTKHFKFVYGIPLILLLNLVIIYLIISYI